MPVARLVKLKPDRRAERTLGRWADQLEGVWNWALSACEREHVWYRVEALALVRRTGRHPRREAWLQHRLFTLLNGHAERCDIPVAVLRQTTQAALRAWLAARERRRAWWAAGGPSLGTKEPRVRRRGVRHPLDWLGADSVAVDLAAGTLAFPGLGLGVREARARGRASRHLRFFRHSAWPRAEAGVVASVAGTVRLLRRPRGWYAALVFPDAAPSLPALAPDAAPVLGADLGFSSVVTLSVFGRDAAEDRLARQVPKASRRESPHPNHQTTRTGRRQKARDRRRRRRGRVARLQQRLVNAKQWRNRRVVRAIQQRTTHLVVLQDRLPALQRVFGRSILRQALGDLVARLVTRQRQGPPTGAAAGGGARPWTVSTVPGAHSTTSCPACQARSGPSGFGQLSIRLWTCSACGARHDRDAAAAQNAVRWHLRPEDRQRVLARTRSGPRRPSTATPAAPRRAA